MWKRWKELQMPTESCGNLLVTCKTEELGRKYWNGS